jgi:4-hydroxy-2-oxoheptanedioate aldolase
MPASYALSRALHAGETVFSGWIGTPDALVVETIARSKFGAVTLDMQHGWHSAGSIHDGIRAIVLAGKPAIVRVPVGDFAFASRALDMGAEAIIAPMVNTVDDARALVDATKYPPVGKRSWGPGRAITLSGIGSGQAYMEWTRANVVTLAMIETRQAIANLDAILDVAGIDGVFVGPSDLSLTLSDGVLVDSLSPTIHDAVALIAARAKAHGKFAAMFASNSDHARAIVAEGYSLVAIGTDAMYLTKGCNDIVDAATS